MSKRDALRASDADRDHVIDRLRRAATEGRIAAEELEQRVSTALKARTYGELETTVADLPRPGRPRSRASSPARSVGRWTYGAVRSYPMLALLLLPLLIATVTLVFAFTVIWAVLVTIALVLGGRAQAPLGVGRRRQHLRAPQRGPGRSWV